MQRSLEPERVCRGLWAADVFAPEECDRLVALCGSLDGWSEAPVLVGRGSGVRPERRRGERLSFTESREIAAAGLDPWVERLQRVAHEIDDRHLRTGFTRIQQLQLIRYEPGGHYAWHIDANDPAHRKVSALCYLTDDAKGGLEGGETAFAPTPLGVRTGFRTVDGALSRVGQVAGMTVVERPRRGRALVFPAWMRHRGAPVRRGSKVLLLAMFV